MSSPSLSPSLWETVKCDFKSLFPEDVFQMWFEPMVCLEATENSMALGVPNDFAAIWIHDNYLDLIMQRLRLSSGRLVNVTLRKADSGGSSRAGAAAGTASKAGAEAATAAARARAASARRAARHDERGPTAGTLIPRNTFETFVVGSNNQMAHAASLAVAQAPAQAYNPLFLYGDTGLGKTHLMHAIGHAILRNNPEARVAYLSTEKFTNEFIQALQENSLTKFRQRYRHADVLLIDDVQFLAGKERIQEEFFHTFNDLFESGKQIVLSSDRRASEILKLEARLVSRFEWGLPADIQAPDYETRFAIIRSKAVSLKCEVPDAVLTFIAQNITRNIRRLEGALIRVASHASLFSKVIDVPTAERLLHDMLMEQAQTLLTIETIQKRVADHYQIRHSDMTSKRRPNNIAIPRQIAMYLARTLTKHSLQEIGDAFGGRDHGTVIHACKSVDNMMEQDASARGSVEFLRTQLSLKPMTLTPEQKKAVAGWAAAGDNLSAIQRKLAADFKVSITYMDLRFLLDDLNLELKDAAPKASTDLAGPGATAPRDLPAGSAPGEPGDELPPEEDLAGAQPPEGTPAAGKITVSVDKVTLIPGALASGTVAFGGGETGKWIVDNQGRPGITQVNPPDFRPSAADGQAFMQELSRVLQERGF